MQKLACQKACTRCLEVLPITDFYTNGKSLTGRCKCCTRNEARTYRQRNAEKVKAADRARRDPEAQRLSARVRREDPEYRARMAEYAREWRSNNGHKEKVYSKSRYEMAKTKPGFVIKRRVATALWRSMQGYQKETSWFVILGYTRDELVAHLERQFTKGMGWDNMGEWHIDHIVPLSSFAIETPESTDFARAWSLTNLRPLWGSENMAKGGKVLTLL